MERGRVIVFVLLGTKGDCFPGFQLACKLQEEVLGSNHKVVVISHREHLDQGRGARAALDSHGVASCPLDLPTAAPRPAEEGDEGDGGGEAVVGSTGFGDEAQWEATIGAVEAALSDMGGAGLLVFNLFAMEMVHMAEHLDIPCIAIHPYPMPYPCISGFEKMFQRENSSLYRALRENEGPLTWRDILHWLWPLFSPASIDFRRRRFPELDPVPFACQMLDTPKASNRPAGGFCIPIQLLYTFSPLVLPVPGYWPESVKVYGFIPTLDLNLGASSPALESLQGSREGLASPRKRPRASSQEALPLEPLTAVRNDTGPSSSAGGLPYGPGTVDPAARTILVDFGGMGRLFLRDPLQVARAVRAAAQSLDSQPGGPVSFLVSCAAFPELAAACTAVEAESSTSDPSLPIPGPPPRALLRPYSGEMSHPEILPRCAAALHHGGSGTTAACLLSGTPQVVCPFFHDQHMWAEAVHHLGVGAQARKEDFCPARQGVGEPITGAGRSEDAGPSDQVPGPPLTTVAAVPKEQAVPASTGALLPALCVALSSRVGERAASLAAVLKAEGGLDRCADALMMLFGTA